MLLLLQSCQCHKVFNIHWRLLSLTAAQDPHFQSGEREDIRENQKIKCSVLARCMSDNAFKRSSKVVGKVLKVNAPPASA